MANFQIVSRERHGSKRWLRYTSYAFALKDAVLPLSLSAVLPDLIKRRRANKKAEHLMLLAGPFRKPVTYWQLNERFSKARAAAAAKALVTPGITS